MSSRMLPVVGVAAGVLAIISFLLPWCSIGTAPTGAELLLGNSGFDLDYHRFMPIFSLLLVLTGTVYSVRALKDPIKGLTPYGIIIVGFIALASSAFFGAWEPIDGYKMMLDGGSGLYLMLSSCTLYILYGIVGYSTRTIKMR